MILLNYHTAAGLRLGIKTELGVLDVRAALAALGPAWAGRQLPVSMEETLAGGLDALGSLRTFHQAALAMGKGQPYLLEEAGLRYAPCIANPGKIICLGLNYRSHVTELAKEPPKHPILFCKMHNTIAACGEEIPLPLSGHRFDYEAELAVVIGKRARNISEAQALDYVIGYCNANDLTERELQFLTGQYLLGKSLDKFFPTGPYLVTTDEIPDPQRLDVRCWVNGELRQRGRTDDMYFSVAHLVSYVSRYMTLLPGDIISTGTPGGVQMGRPEPKWLVPGDEVIVEVSSLGRLVNRMVRGE